MKFFVNFTLGAILLMCITFCRGQKRCSDILSLRRVDHEYWSQFEVIIPYSPEDSLVTARVYISFNPSNKVDVALALQDSRTERLDKFITNKPIRYVLVSNAATSQDFFVTKIDIQTSSSCLIICSEPRAERHDTVQAHATINWYPLGKQNAKKSNCRPNSFTAYIEVPTITTNLYRFDDDNCGVVKRRLTFLVLNGLEIEEGEWPWLVAIYIKLDQAAKKFQCGGTLITSRAVVSAAHCFVNRHSIISERDVIMYMGKYRLSDLNDTNSVEYETKDLFIHSDYRKGSNDADIALVITKIAVSFTDYIKPACMWSGSSNIDDIAGNSSTVVGWGQNLRTDISDIPQKAYVKIVTEHECLTSNDAFRDITTKRSFCAGNITEQSGPCQGDSGGGLMVHFNNRWMIRGVVSSSFALTSVGRKLCDLENYVIYSDIAKFKLWIQMKLLDV